MDMRHITVVSLISIRSKLARHLSALSSGIVTAFKAAPLEAVTLVVCGIIGGVTPVLVAWFQKGLIDHFESAIRSNTIGWTAYVYWVAGLLVFLAVAADASASIQVFAMTGLRDKLEGFIKGRLFTRINQAKDLDLFEDPAQLDALNLAQQAIPRFQQIDNCLATLILGIFGTVPAILLSTTLSWWVPLFLCATVIPAGLVQFRLESQVWSAEGALVETRRRQHLVEETITRPAFAKDVRLFSLGNLLIGRWKDLFSSNVDYLHSLRYSGLRKTIALSTIGALGIIVPLLFVLNGVVSGTESLGNLVLFLGIGFSLRLGFQHLFWVSSQLAGVAMAISHFESFMTSTPSRVAMQSEDTPPPPLKHNLSLHDVSFTYSGATAPALSDISVDIFKGDTIAIVGSNGAGKSTLAKLIGRLYAPSRGSILWDGTDIATFEIDAWRNRLGFMSQDTAELPLTLKEYLDFSRLGNTPDPKGYSKILAASRLSNVVSRLELGLDTPLAKELPGGTQLSGGEWQRLSLARVALRASDADLLILDEPTSAIDPAVEHEIIGRILELSQGRTAIIITHRLGLCTKVDRIVVLHDGRKIEEGSHTALMALGGHYADMFQKQAQMYQSAP